MTAPQYLVGVRLAKGEQRQRFLPDSLSAEQFVTHVRELLDEGWQLVAMGWKHGERAANAFCTEAHLMEGWCTERCIETPDAPTCQRMALWVSGSLPDVALV